jgi:hypothetical protein
MSKELETYFSLEKTLIVPETTGVVLSYLVKKMLDNM